MFAARSNFAVASLDDRIYAIGGFNGDYSYHTSTPTPPCFSIFKTNIFGILCFKIACLL